MLRRHGHLLQALAVAFDSIAVALCWMLGYLVRFSPLLYPSGMPAPPLLEFLGVLPIVIGSYLIVAALLGLYTPDNILSRHRELSAVAKASFLGWLGLVAALYYYRGWPYSRGVLLIFLLADPLALLLSRGILHVTIRALLSRGWAGQRAAIIGSGVTARKLSRRLSGNPVLGFRVEYLVSVESGAIEDRLDGVPVKGSCQRLVECIREHPVDVVFVAVCARHSGRVTDIVDQLVDLPVHVAVVPDFADVLTLNVGAFDLAGMPVIQLRASPLHGWNAVIKRVLDLTLCTVLLLVCGAPMLLLSLLIKLGSPGPVLFKQLRMGLGGRPFTMLKFRTMRVDAESETGPVWATQHDPRCTALGRILRRLSLDELPQLLNVLRGEMSLVGPRPERPHFVQQFVSTHRGYMLRHSVKAGMTGWAQINGLRGNTPLQKRLEYDLFYINNWSLGFDLLILLLTPLRGLVSKNAY